MFFKNQKRNPFSAYRAFMSPYKWTSSVMAWSARVTLASRSKILFHEVIVNLVLKIPDDTYKNKAQIILWSKIEIKLLKGIFL